MAGTKLGSSGVVGDSNPLQVTSRLFTSGTATSRTRLPSLLWPALWAVRLGQRGSVKGEINWSWCLRTTIPSSSSTRVERGPVSWMIVPGTHFDPQEYFRTLTASPSFTPRVRLCWSCCFFCLDWAKCTLVATSGRSRSRWDLRLRPHRNLAGGSPVVLCRVIR